MATKVFKIALVGDAGVGKTTFMKRHLTGEFERKYVPTLGVEVHPLTFHTNRGVVVFNCWDTAGQEKFGGMRSAYYLKTDGVIAMADITSKVTMKNLSKWIQDVEAVTSLSGGSPVVICYNKADVITVVDPLRVQGYHQFIISTKSTFNYEMPFLYLARKLTGDETLEFIPKPATSPPLISVSTPAKTNIVISQNVSPYELARIA